ncbi:GntR family transcriptional regulator [Pseudalkalibacillus sp. Hm43]|uniref:GntR family transcriptional regulator n=1 Tax=Pseudalkalibacillus sp. Hm43 TaxID=3450742 RepID=UPI003F442B25
MSKNFFQIYLPKLNLLVYNQNCINNHNTVSTDNTVGTDGREYMFNLDVRSRKPIYEQLVERFKELIISEVMKKDEKLPSVRTLAQQLTINPNTIQKAYRELETQGYIYSIKGKGSFVSETTDVVNTEKLQKVEKDLSKLILEALYLGMTVPQLQALVEETEKSIGGGEQDDRSE